MTFFIIYWILLDEYLTDDKYFTSYELDILFPVVYHRHDTNIVQVESTIAVNKLTHRRPWNWRIDNLLAFLEQFQLL